MRGRHRWTVGPLLLLALLLPGCGESSPAGSSTLRLESPGLARDGTLLPSSECGYGTVWLPLRWSEVPDDTAELLLYIGQFTTEEAGGKTRVEVPYASVILGIAPGRREIGLNTIPEEAEPRSFRAFNSCPNGKGGQRFLFRLFALGPDADPDLRALSRASVTQLTEEGLGIRRPATTSRWASELTDETLASGGFVVRYVP